MSDRELILLQVARRGARGDLDTGSLDWSIIRNEVDQLLARANITKLDDVPDVAAPSPASGQFLMWNGSAWAPAAVTSGIPSVKEGGTTTIETNVATLDFEDGAFNVTNPTDGWAAVFLNFGGSGTSNQPARYDHAHTNPAPVRSTFAPQAYMSSGTRNLGSTTVTLPSGISCVVKSKINMQMRGADPGACYYQLRLTINGNARTSNGGATGFWCVQGVPDKTTWEHHLTLTGAGTAITVSADCIYYGGGGFYTDAGEIVVDVAPAR